MTSREFELLDALYFTISFDQLEKEIGWETLELRAELFSLIKKGWVRCMEKETDMEIEDELIMNQNFRKYNYLATKQGLLEHNSK